MIEERTALIEAARERLAARRERVDRALQELLAEK